MTDARERMIQEIPSLRRYARFLVREADYADDLVQECLARAVANIERWQPGTNMKGWLVVMLRNIFINDIKRRRHRPVLTFDGAIEQLGGVAHGGQEERVHLDDVQRAFNRLTRDHREVLLLIAVEGLQYEEVAAVLELPIGTVRSRISRAREALLAQLESQAAPGGENEAASILSWPRRRRGRAAAEAAEPASFEAEPGAVGAG
jgi:RNA polymerase sigma-70 factor (ECF subfamily)